MIEGTGKRLSVFPIPISTMTLVSQRQLQRPLAPVVTLHSETTTVGEGSRNASLTSLAGTLRRKGLGFEEAIARLCRRGRAQGVLRGVGCSVARPNPSNEVLVATGLQGKHPNAEVHISLSSRGKAQFVEPGRVKCLSPLNSPKTVIFEFVSTSRQLMKLASTLVQEKSKNALRIPESLCEAQASELLCWNSCARFL
jgi:hypothetical protein